MPVSCSELVECHACYVRVGTVRRVSGVPYVAFGSSGWRFVYKCTSGECLTCFGLLAESPEWGTFRVSSNSYPLAALARIRFSAMRQSGSEAHRRVSKEPQAEACLERCSSLGIPGGIDEAWFRRVLPSSTLNSLLSGPDAQARARIILSWMERSDASFQEASRSLCSNSRGLYLHEHVCSEARESSAMQSPSGSVPAPARERERESETE